MTFKVLHIKNSQPIIEPTVDHSGSHVKWNVTSLSPVGPIFQTSEPVEHHGVVMVYKQQGADNNNYMFHVYLAPNSSSDIKVSASEFGLCVFQLFPGLEMRLFLSRNMSHTESFQIDAELFPFFLYICF